MAVLDRELTDIETGKNKRLIVMMPPRHGKSELTSRYFPAHYLGLNPTHRVMLASATDSLAQYNSRFTRKVVREHGHWFGLKLREDAQAVHSWELESGGEVRSGGVGSGEFMGRGADLLIIDDYFRNVEAALSEVMREKIYQWYLSTTETRLTPDGAVVIMATRWHPKDLIGQVLETGEEIGEEWRVVSFPAIGNDGAALWPEQWPIDKLEKRRAKYYASGYPWMWEALYQQQPPDVLDAEWPSHYFDNIWCDRWPAQNERHLVAMALDPSLGKSDKADYSAFVAVCKGHDGVYYVDADIARRDSTRIVNDGIDILNRINPDFFGCEAVCFQELLRQQFEDAMPRTRLNPYGVYAIHNHLPKETRIRSLTRLLATGRIKVRKNPGGALLVEQLKGFPSHKFKDGPDALEMAIRFVEELLQGTGIEEPEWSYA